MLGRSPPAPGTIQERCSNLLCFLADKVLLLVLDRIKEGRDHHPVGKHPACQRRVSLLAAFVAGKLHKDLQDQQIQSTKI